MKCPILLFRVSVPAVAASTAALALLAGAAQAAPAAAHVPSHPTEPAVDGQIASPGLIDHLIVSHARALIPCV